MPCAASPRSPTRSCRMQPPDAFVLDRRAVRAHFDRASGSYDAAAVLQTRVREELLSRLDLIGVTPAVVVDLGCGTGQGARQLKDRYRGAMVVALDPAVGMLRETRRRSGWLRPLQRVCGDVFQLPLRDGTVDLMFSNLMLQWCDDLDAATARGAAGPRAGGVFRLHDLRSGYLVRAAPRLDCGRWRHPRQRLSRYARHRGCADARRPRGAGAGRSSA